MIPNGYAQAKGLLLPQHLADLYKSGLSDEQIAQCGFRSLQAPASVQKALRWQSYNGELGDCLAIPFRDADGKALDYCRLKPDRPRTANKDGKRVKYESPKGASNHPYFPPGTLAALKDPAAPLVVTEGEKKAAKADQEGFACIGLVGVYGWQQKRAKDKDGKPQGDRELIPGLAGIPWQGRPVFLVFDSDAADNPNVRLAEWYLAEVLARHGATVKVGRIPARDPGVEGPPAKVGLDDFLVGHGPDAFRKLLTTATEPEPPAGADGFRILSCRQLVNDYPDRRPAVVHGLLREGETMNIIAAPKIGKSWLTLDLAFAVATGGLWLATFPTTPGNVLLIDNELHRETSAHRLRTLAEWLKLPLDTIGDKIDVANLRGRLQSLQSMGHELRKIDRGRYALVIIDAFYRTLPKGTDENDNASMAELYNLLDCYAEALGAAFALVHHASKGSQSAKAVTDVGAGAGAQSRATDTHLILRPHEEDNAVVLDAAVRSWPPVEACCLRWSFPTWTPAPDLDPLALRDGRPRRRKPEAPRQGDKPREPPWTARRFADTFGKPEPRPRAAILEDARPVLSDRKAEALLKGAIECGYLFAWKEAGANSKTLVSTVKPPEPAPAPEPPAAPEEAGPPAKPKRSRKRAKCPPRGAK
jgi:hypothetical protein